MKKTILSLTTILALGLTGCGGGSGDTGAKKTTSANMVVKNADGTTFGVTRAEDEIVNGGVPIYDVGTGEQIGFIQVDGSANNKGGESLGACTGATDDKGNFTTECTLETTTHNNGDSSESDTGAGDTATDGGVPDQIDNGYAPVADLSTGTSDPTYDGSSGIDPSANLGN